MGQVGLAMSFLRNEIPKTPFPLFWEVRRCQAVQCLVYSIPTSLFLVDKEPILTKDLFTDCIQLSGNTLFDSFEISPELPQDIAFDAERNCIGGTYRGTNLGKQDYTIIGTNIYGSVKSTIRLYFTCRFMC